MASRSFLGYTFFFFVYVYWQLSGAVEFNRSESLRPLAEKKDEIGFSFFFFRRSEAQMRNISRLSKQLLKLLLLATFVFFVIGWEEILLNFTARSKEVRA